ncbi:MAG: hypothetical protein IT436_07865 [Phycisphaerales bacterium]|nr:hypothetical protein [Phycisphaerales bacterium]
MSAKWERSKRWDDQHIPPALWPVKWLLRALSSIWLAVILLLLVAAYGALASIPIGMVAQIPTFLIYGITLVVTVAVAAGVPWFLARTALKRAPLLVRFPVLFLVLVGFGILGGVLWFRELWPALHYDPATGRGLMLFSGFVKANSATTLRRLPILEMSELEFYSWWPLRVVLLLFVLNLVVATIRRIEFIFVNIGVLTVHTGIVVIALGSVYYSGLKLEGDTILLAGQPDRGGTPGPGPFQDAFYDNTRVALYISQDRGWEARVLRGVPRYNDYNIGAVSSRTATEASRRDVPWLTAGNSRPLDIAVPASPLGLVDPALSFRLVGFASYAESVEDWAQVDPSIPGAVAPGRALNPLRTVYLYSELPDQQGRVSTDPAFAFTLLPAEARTRIAENAVMSVEYTIGMSESRWSDLSTPLPEGARGALIVEVPGKGEGGGVFRAVYPATPRQDIKVGETGYTLNIKELAPSPPFPIITPGYRDAQSSMAVVRITGPDGQGFDRWVYHRFPEISQDMLDEVNDRGMPKRRDPDPAVSVRYIDAGLIHVYFDERPDGACRALIREPGGKVRTENLAADGLLKDMVPKVSLRLAERWAHAEPIERPMPVEPAQQDRSLIGTRDKSMLAVEVSLAGTAWKRIVWLPFTRYLGLDTDTERPVELPDGRRLRLAFGRQQHSLGNPSAPFRISLVNFEMIAYDHRGAPRDYQSVVRVEPSVAGTFAPYEHITKLNAPLRAPFMWSGARSWIANAGLTFAGGLSPFQFKLSQAGWDAEGWKQSQALADQGLIPRPYAQFTILGVGNNPGIHIVALGAVLMAIGIPWAFYIKPLILRRRKAQIQARIAAGTYTPPARRGGPARAAGAGLNGSTNGAADSPHDDVAEAGREPAHGGRLR